MSTLARYLLAAAIVGVVSLLAPGCASVGAGDDAGVIQPILDDRLPPDFEGSIEIEHRNPYTTLRIDAGGVRRTPDGWTWEWLRYRREGRVSHGTVTLGRSPPGDASPPTPAAPRP